MRFGGAGGAGKPPRRCNVCTPGRGLWQGDFRRARRAGRPPPANAFFDGWNGPPRPDKALGVGTGPRAGISFTAPFPSHRNGGLPGGPTGHPPARAPVARGDGPGDARAVVQCRARPLRRRPDARQGRGRSAGETRRPRRGGAAAGRPRHARVAPGRRRVARPDLAPRRPTRRRPRPGRRRRGGPGLPARPAGGGGGRGVQAPPLRRRRCAGALSVRPARARAAGRSGPADPAPGGPAGGDRRPRPVPHPRLSRPVGRAAERPGPGDSPRRRRRAGGADRSAGDRHGPRGVAGVVGGESGEAGRGPAGGVSGRPRRAVRPRPPAAFGINRRGPAAGAGAVPRRPARPPARPADGGAGEPRAGRPGGGGRPCVRPGADGRRRAGPRERAAA